MPAQTANLSFWSNAPDPPLGSQDALLLISHDCDVCCNDPEEEPLLEMIPARQVTEVDVDENLLAGRSPAGCSSDWTLGAYTVCALASEYRWKGRSSNGLSVLKPCRAKQ